MKAQLAITPSESKRLIAKAVKEHPAVRKALREGIVAIALGSTNAFVVEEITDKKIEKGRYLAGLIDEKGTCVIPKSERLSSVILEKGKAVEAEVEEVVKKMRNRDVFIKGANAIDTYGIAGVMMAGLAGGTIAKVLGILKARGARVIIPVGLEKLIPSSISEVSTIAGIYEMDYSNGIPVGIMPVSGEIITEIEAFKILAGVRAVALASGGIGKGSGSKVFLIDGKEKDVRKIIGIVEGIKGEENVPSLRGKCSTCEYSYCPLNKRNI